MKLIFLSILFCLIFTSSYSVEPLGVDSVKVTYVVSSDEYVFDMFLTKVPNFDSFDFVHGAIYRENSFYWEISYYDNPPWISRLDRVISFGKNQEPGSSVFLKTGDQSIVLLEVPIIVNGSFVTFTIPSSYMSYNGIMYFYFLPFTYDGMLLPGKSGQSVKDPPDVSIENSTWGDVKIIWNELLSR